MRSVRTLVLLLGLIPLIWLSVLLFFVPHSVAQEAATIGRNVASFEDLSSRFEKLAESDGALFAYQVLVSAPLPPQTDLHLLGHVIGDVLYKQEGLSGIAHCTQDFRNACSHSIVIGALNEFGAEGETVEKIRNACTKAPGGKGAYTMCFHGLGHGVFAYFRYEIPETVIFCKRLGTDAYHDQEYTQCVGGMIMELVGGGGHDTDAWLASRVKYLSSDDPLQPCNTALIPDEAKSFCYTYQTPWLLTAAGADLGTPDPSTFPSAFAFCGRVLEEELRGACWGSFGKEFIPLAAARDIRRIDELNDEAYGRALSWCALARNGDAVDACVRQALGSVFWGGENDAEASFRFCAIADRLGTGHACYQELGDAIVKYTDGQMRTSLCEKIPANYKQGCGDEL